MTLTVILDSAPLGMLTLRPGVAAGDACKVWLQTLADSGVRIVLPEIVDYEIRRELLRLNSTQSLSRLDTYCAELKYLPITTAAMREAARLWALARQQGQPTAGVKALDADMILIAQTLLLGEPAAVIATTNLRHLTRFTPAALWQDVTPPSG